MIDENVTDFFFENSFGYGQYLCYKISMITQILFNVEAVVQRCSVKMVFLYISQISQENTCARVSFLIQLQAGLQLY